MPAPTLRGELIETFSTALLVDLHRRWTGMRPHLREAVELELRIRDEDNRKESRMKRDEILAEQLRLCLFSSSECDREFAGPANVVDGLFALARSVLSAGQQIKEGLEVLAKAAAPNPEEKS